MWRLFKLLNFILYQTAAILLTIFLLLNIPILLLLVTPIYIYRFLISILIKILRPDLGKLLSAKSALFAVDDMTKPLCTLIVPLIVEGHLGVEELRNVFKERLLQSSNRNPDGTLANPELTQYISSWMGFFCWKPDKEFKIENHVNLYEGPLSVSMSESGKIGQIEQAAFDEDIIHLVLNELIHRPFRPRRSPWEFCLLHNNPSSAAEGEGSASVKGNENPNADGDTNNCTLNGPGSGSGKPQTLVLFRVHHALADGFSILKFLVKDISMQEKGSSDRDRVSPKNRNRNKTRPSKRNIFSTLSFLIRAPFELTKLCMEVAGGDKNAWHKPKRELVRSITSAMSTAISLGFIKEIKNFTGATSTGVIQAAITGGVRNFMISHGITVPKNIHCLTPLPMHGHPDKLRNHLTFCVTTLPLGISQPENRLKYLEARLRENKTSTVPVTTFLALPFLGALFPCLIRPIRQHFLVTGVISNFAGPPQCVDFVGHPVTWVHFAGGMLPGDIGVGFTCLSFNGNVRIMAGINQSIIAAPNMMNSLVRSIVHEFYILRKCGNATTV